MSNALKCTMYEYYRESIYTYMSSCLQACLPCKCDTQREEMGRHGRRKGTHIIDDDEELIPSCPVRENLNVSLYE